MSRSVVLREVVSSVLVKSVCTADRLVGLVTSVIVHSRYCYGCDQSGGGQEAQESTDDYGMTMFTTRPTVETTELCGAARAQAGQHEWGNLFS